MHCFTRFIYQAAIQSRELKRHSKAPTLPLSAAGSLALCLDFDCETGFEIHGEVIFENNDLGDQPFEQCLVKLGDVGGLALDEILQVADLLHLLIPNHGVHLGLFAHVAEPEYFIRDGVVIVLLIGLLHQFLLQLPQALVDALRREGVVLTDHGGDIGLQLLKEIVLLETMEIPMHSPLREG